MRHLLPTVPQIEWLRYISPTFWCLHHQCFHLSQSPVTLSGNLTNIINQLLKSRLLGLFRWITPMISWSWPAAKNPPSHSLTPPERMGDRIRRPKVRKLVGQGKDSLVSEQKKMKKNDVKAVIHHLPQADWTPSFSLTLINYNRSPLTSKECKSGLLKSMIDTFVLIVQFQCREKKTD